MPVRIRYILLFNVILVTVTITILHLPTNQKNSLPDTAVNKNILSVNSFDINSDSTELNTSAKGTVFVSGDKGQVEQIRIVAMLEIDPDDWGGVAFYIPDKWSISNMSSSYPDTESQIIPADYVSVWTNAQTESNQWSKMIEVGRDRNYKPTGGGKGTFIFDIVPDESADITGNFNLGVEVGSADNGSFKVMGTDSIEIPIKLMDFVNKSK